MKRLRHLNTAALALALTTTLLASSAFAQVITSLDDIQYWVGTGSNRAGLVIDWNQNQNPNSFAWGYRWDGTATGEDMFRAIAGRLAEALNPAIPGPAVPDSSGDPALSLYILNYSFGPSVDRIAYDAAGGLDQDSAGFSNGFWSYWTATAEAYPATWTSSQVGFADRVLANQAWDGWSYVPDFTGVAPDAPIAAVPEPSTWILLALGGGVLCWQVRRRRTARNA